MKRILTVFLLFLMLISCAGCKEKADLEAPALGDYEVEVNGRTYTTRGTPFCHIPTVENRGYLDYRTVDLGTVGQELSGTFPAGTTVHGLKGCDNRFVLVAVLPETQHCYMLTSFEYYEDITVGRTVVDPLEFNNSFAYVYRYNKDKTGFVFIPMTSTQLADLGTAFAEAPVTQPSGKSVELIMQNFEMDYALFTLYENGAIVYQGCPQYAFDLGAEMGALLWEKATA